MTDDKLADPLPPPPETEDVPSAQDRLRAFEDAKLGPDAPRYNGQVEKGHGSFFKSNKLTDADRAHHAALEHLVETEKQVAEARGALAVAEQSHADADRRVELSVPVAPKPAPVPPTPTPTPTPTPALAPAPVPEPAIVE